MARRNQISDTLECIARAPKSGRTVDVIANKTGLHRLTVYRHVRSLVADGLVVEAGTAPTGSRGRPPTVYRVAS